MIIFSLHFWVMLTTLKAINVASTWTNYVNDWDRRMEWEAGPNRMVTGVYSVHNNHKDDRRWKFSHGVASGVTTSGCHWSSAVNDYDERLSFTCNRDHAICGFASWHDNHREDRRWKIQCCRVNGATLSDQGWTGYKNEWDHKLKYRCPSDDVVTGLYSYHSNSREDRRWKVRCARLTAYHGHRIEASLSGYANDLDAYMHWDAGRDGMITGFNSNHDNGKEDRRWRFYHGSTDLPCVQGHWSGYKNNWDGELSFSCPNRAVLNGVTSIHDNGRDDRRWKFRCCELPNTVSVVPTGYGEYTDYDNPIDWYCPRATQAIVALKSYHNNYKEDRRWTFACGEIRA